MTQLDVEEHAATALPEAGWGPLAGLPGHPMMWVLIASELAVFGALIVAFGIAGALEPDLFAAGRDRLDPLLGGINTLVLVTSGFLAAMAVDAADAGRRRTARLHVAGAIILGGLFVIVKLIEYQAKLAAGIGIETDRFFTLYFLVTGFHLLHVLLGMVILAAVAVTDADLRTGTAFWHMVDLVLVVLYPLVYLAG
ncbi:cytochrome c oxidase subunit 3 [Chelatococcus daeguensis]|uniref:cytochrome c oxidase subunit 3 n=1 Tax=Chelatococcus daeguensis TaxID=444444 RepID=UPI0007ABAE59|nr:cytochrome c oxidase subunit 3 [Chelatococcus daeguensis]KZE29261.1 copper oxidase [Chelatococcus daeguensis]MBM3083987.1 cytochrome c oxidase subunit 3 [Chelatococcus daeguensis]